MPEPESELPLVKNSEEMDVETFLKHINARHVPIGGMTVFGRSKQTDDENESLLRAYHLRIHELGRLDSKYTSDTPINHRHKDKQ